MSLFVSLIVSSIGMGYFIYGKKGEKFSFLMLGLILMVYPYFVGNIALSILIGIILIACPFILKGLN